MKKKTFAVFVALILVISAVIGGTLAWLQAESEEVVNTFTFGDINIDLNETDVDGEGGTKTNAYKLIPGELAVKDPKVTVEKGSEECYVFVKVTETNNTLGTGKVIEYTVDAANWKLVSEDKENNIYIYVYTNNTAAAAVVDASASAVVTKSVLAEILDSDNTKTGKHIEVNSALTKEDIEEMAASTDAETGAEIAAKYPEIRFDACAVQSDTISYAEAERIAIGLLNPTAGE